MALKLQPQNSEGGSAVTLAKMDSGEQSDFSHCCQWTGGPRKLCQSGKYKRSRSRAGKHTHTHRAVGSAWGLNGFFFQEGNAAIYEEARLGWFFGKRAMVLRYWSACMNDELNSLGY